MASVVLSFGGKEVKTYELSKQATVVGRDPGVDIVIDNLGVSRSHCQFLLRGADVFIQDMNSANGTYVNGQRVGEHNLTDSDQIVVGKYVMTFKSSGGAATGGAAAPAGVSTAPAADRVVPDSLNTYMMDGDKIKERLEEMRRKDAGGTAPAEEKPAAPAPVAAAPSTPAPPQASAPAAPPPPAQEEKERPERHTRIVMGTGRGGLSPDTIKRYLYFSLLLNIVLIVAFGILYSYYLRRSQEVDRVNPDKTPRIIVTPGGSK